MTITKEEEQNCGNCAYQTLSICWNEKTFYGEETKLDDWCWHWKKLPKKQEMQDMKLYYVHFQLLFTSSKH